jgi:iron complex outermembrane receptor protein
MTQGSLFIEGDSCGFAGDAIFRSPFDIFLPALSIESLNDPFSLNRRETGVKRILLFIGMVLLASSALARGEDETLRLDDVTVTAQKFSQQENRTPIGMDVFSADEVQDLQLHTLKDLSLYSSNVHVKADNVGNSAIIRGIAPFTATLTGPAGVFIDGVALPTVFMQQPELLAVQRVEVLKGPQGTLYGSNTESGVINMVTTTPGNRMEATAGGEYYLFDKDGTPGGFRLQTAGSGPLVRDRLYLGLAASLNRTDGFFDNLYNGDDRAGELDRKDFRFKLRTTPTARLEATLSSLYMDAEDAKGKFRYAGGPAATERYTINYDDRYDQDYSGSVSSLQIRYGISGLELHSITGLTLYDRAFAKDFDGTPAARGLSLFDLDDRALSEELRLQAKDGRWLTGLFVSTRSTDVLFEKTGVGQRRDTDISTDTFALFGQYSLPVTANGSVDLGLRLERTRVSADMDYRMAGGVSSFDDAETFHQFLPRISYNHAIGNGVLYASAARGYLAGGANYNLATSAANLLYDSEETLSYEIGYKAVFAGGKCRLSAALFYVDMDDKQVVQSVPSAMGAMTIDNAAGAYSCGAELDFKAQLAAGLELFANGGLTRARVKKWSGSSYNTASGTYEDYDYAGNRLPGVPSYTLSGGLFYLHRSGLFTRGDVTATSSYYHDGANTLKEGAVATVNLSLGYMSEHVTLTLWCKNLFDTAYAESATYWGLYEVVEDAAPRTIGLRLDYRL